MPYNKVWSYVNHRVEEDGVLPSFTEIFNQFECDTDVIEDAVQAVVRCTRMDGVKIEWRGELEGAPLILPSAM